MDTKKYEAYKDALEAAKNLDDKELISAITARAIAENGLDDDVELLIKYHT